MQVSFSSADLLSIAQPKQTRGATTEAVHGIGALSTAGPGELSFLGNPKYRTDVATTKASVVLLPADYDGQPQPNQLFLLVDNPSAALARFCSRVEQVLWPKPAPGIHPSAQVAKGAKVAASATVGPLCVIEDGAIVGEYSHLQAQVFVGRNAQIGDNCWLMPGVILAAECILRNRVRLQPAVVVGSDGFGYEFVAGRHEKVPQVGYVLIEDDVEIGANSNVDRARFNRTQIGEGTKIDNSVQIAHNVIIGRHCIICALVGIAGSVTIEDYVVVGGQAGLAGHITVGKGSRIDGQSGVNSDLEPKSFVKGSPCAPYMLMQRVNVLSRRLPDLFKRVDELEKSLRES